MDGLQKGDYDIAVSPDGGTVWAKTVRVTVKGSVI
jgi:hypothetical protein